MDDEKGEMDSTVGFRIYDDEGQTYCNTMSAEELLLPDKEFLQLIIDKYEDDIASEMFDFACEHGIQIDDEFYPASWVADAFNGDGA